MKSSRGLPNPQSVTTGKSGGYDLSGPPAFQFYAPDFYISVASMSLEERGAHVTLLVWSWDNGPVPNDMRRISRILGCDLRRTKRLTKHVFTRWILDHDHWTNKRLEETRQRQLKYSASRSYCGKQGGRPKAYAKPYAKHMGKHTESPPISNLRSPDQQQEKIKIVSSETLRVSEPPALEFPTIGSGPKAFGLTHQQISEWTILYPGVDVWAECRKALAWCQAQPNRRKTARGMPKFLVSWLNRSTDGPRTALAPITAANGQGKGLHNVSVFRKAAEAQGRLDDERRARSTETSGRLSIVGDIPTDEIG